MSSADPNPATASTNAPIRLLFVCLGNICRSPMAHAVAQDLISKLPSPPAPGPDPARRRPAFELDSAGTGAYHAGSDPDPRTISTLKRHGITGFEHAARKIRTADFWTFDYVLAMDEENLEDLRAVRARAEREVKTKGEGGKLARLCMFGDFGGSKGEVIDDPWYGGGAGFETAYAQCVRFTKGLLREVMGEDVG